jgi:hypothetical protein
MYLPHQTIKANEKALQTAKKSLCVLPELKHLNIEVPFQNNYGDYIRTVVAIELLSESNLVKELFFDKIETTLMYQPN